ncbi:MAG: hypothetical protein IKR03_00835 [Clostridia bacterium]|nr:hypothetical protein [Clostridia bacterium]
MTKRVYDNDPHVSSCSAKVTGCESYGDKSYIITTDQTCIFPGGGGQPSDIAYIDDVQIDKMIEKNGEIYYISPIRFDIGKSVVLRIDFDYRQIYMQIHSAEHIVSGLIFKEYGFNNVGFHMNDKFATIDIDGMLDARMVKNIEIKANQAVMSDIPVEILYPEDIHEIEVRKYPDVDEQIRVVRIPGIDSCGCCGVHVARTGEIGLIKILTSEKHRGGTRLTLTCGMNAVADYLKRYDDIMSISYDHSSNPDEIVKTVSNIEKRLSDIKSSLLKISNSYFDMIIKSSKSDNSIKNILSVYLEDLETDDIRRLAIKAAQSFPMSVVISGSKGRYLYSIVSNADTDTDSRILDGLLKERFTVRGGGKKDICQGSIYHDNIDEVLEYINCICGPKIFQA